MALGRGIKTPVGIIVAFSVVLAILTASFVMMGSDGGRAELFPKNVRGFVEDLGGAKISGANVVVEILAQGSGTVRGTFSTTTNTAGFYQVGVPGANWDGNDTIRVTATYDIYTNQNSTLALWDAPIQYVNVTLSLTIPEFGDLIKSSASVVSLGLIAIIIIIARKRRNAGPLAPG